MFSRGVNPAVLRCPDIPEFGAVNHCGGRKKGRRLEPPVGEEYTPLMYSVYDLVRILLLPYAQFIDSKF